VVRSSVIGSDPTVPTIRPVITHHDAHRARVCLLPEGALLLAGDAIELDLTIDPGVTLEVVEPGGTVAYDMHGGRASWDVAVSVGAGARLSWAGEPFVVAEGAQVDRRTRIRYAEGARVALREVVVLGRHAERPGRVRLRADVRRDRRPVLVEDLDLGPASAPTLLGRHRVLASVLSLGTEGATDGVDVDRFDLARAGATLWRTCAHQAHQTRLEDAWTLASRAELTGND
jgi:urease accessory protein